MTATRSIKEARWYRGYTRRRKGGECPFCAIKKGSEQLVEESANFKVIINFLPYSLWDGQGVVDHLMIVPKSHTDNLKGMSDKMAGEYMKIISDYETQGYNLYARAPVSSRKSIHHHHMHLIKLDHKTRNWLFLLHKPFYIRMSR